jgi:hypothetical protein
MKAELQELSKRLTVGSYWMIPGSTGIWHLKIIEGANNFLEDSFRITAQAILVKEKEFIPLNETIFVVTGLFNWIPQAECQFIAIHNLYKNRDEETQH